MRQCGVSLDCEPLTFSAGREMTVETDEEVFQLKHLWADNHTASSHTNPKHCTLTVARNLSSSSLENKTKTLLVQIMDGYVAVVHKLTQHQINLGKTDEAEVRGRETMLKILQKVLTHMLTQLGYKITIEVNFKRSWLMQRQIPFHNIHRKNIAH